MQLAKFIQLVPNAKVVAANLVGKNDSRLVNATIVPYAIFTFASGDKAHPPPQHHQWRVYVPHAHRSRLVTRLLWWLKLERVSKTLGRSCVNAWKCLVESSPLTHFGLRLFVTELFQRVEWHAPSRGQHVEPRRFVQVASPNNTLRFLVLIGAPLL